MGSIIKRERVNLTEGQAPPVAPAPAAAPRAANCAPHGGTHGGGAHGGPVARLVKAGGRVRAIELTCACGTTTVLEVDYDVVADDAPKEMS